MYPQNSLCLSRGFLPAPCHGETSRGVEPAGQSHLPCVPTQRHPPAREQPRPRWPCPCGVRPARCHWAARPASRGDGPAPLFSVSLRSGGRALLPAGVSVWGSVGVLWRAASPHREGLTVTLNRAARYLHEAAWVAAATSRMNQAGSAVCSGAAVGAGPGAMGPERRLSQPTLVRVSSKGSFSRRPRVHVRPLGRGRGGLSKGKG